MFPAKENMANSKFEDYKGSLSGKGWVFDNGEGWKQDLSIDSDKTSEQRTKVGSTNKRSCKTVPRRWEGLQWDKKKGKHDRRQTEHVKTDMFRLSV